MNFAEFWGKIKDFFINNYVNIIMFVCVLFIGLVLVKIVLNVSRRLLNKSKIEKITQNFILAFIKFFAYLLLLLGLLSIMGIAITGVITAFSACLLAVGVALKDNIANLANGIIIVSTGMFKCGDFVSIDGSDATGQVVKINFLFTTLLTTDNKKITLPNNMIVSNAVTNFGANNTRRVDFNFSVAYESDVELVKKIVIDVIKSNGCVRLDLKEPFCRLKNLGASSIDFFAHCWVDSEDYWDVYYYVIENVFNEFKRNNISIPYNQLEIRNRVDEVVMPVEGEKLGERVEKVRSENFVIDLENDSLTDILKKKRVYEQKLKRERKKKLEAKKHEQEVRKHELEEQKLKKAAEKAEKEGKKVNKQQAKVKEKNATLKNQSEETSNSDDNKK